MERYDISLNSIVKRRSGKIPGSMVAAFVIRFQSRGFQRAVGLKSPIGKIFPSGFDCKKRYHCANCFLLSATAHLRKPTHFGFKDIRMRRTNQPTEVAVTNDSHDEQPIPSAWRPTLQKIVDSLVRHDYGLAHGIAGVAPVSAETATQMRTFIQAYGARLVSLPQEAWTTSVCIWMGDHWDALIDLWTEEEGSSDLVLQVHVSQAGSEPLVSVYMVYVP